MEIIEMLAHNENLISRLYTTYANKFQQDHQFWNDLVADEVRHASIIHELNSKVDSGEIDVDIHRFNTATFRTYAEYLQEEHTRAQNERMFPINALSIAKYIEQSLIERRFFEVFKGDTPALIETLAYLKTETQQHIKKIEEKLLQYT